MKRVFVMLVLFCTISVVSVSCRDTKKEKVEDAADDVGDALEDAADDVGDAVDEGVDEVKENTGNGGTDDN